MFSEIIAMYVDILLCRDQSAMPGTDENCNCEYPYRYSRVYLLWVRVKAIMTGVTVMWLENTWNCG